MKRSLGRAPETSQERTVQSLLPVASSLPSGAKATPLTAAACPSSLARSRGVPVTFHSRTVPSPQARARRLPPGEKDNPTTLPALGLKARRGFGLPPDGTPHKSTVPSKPAEASVPFEE